MVISRTLWAKLEDLSYGHWSLLEQFCYSERGYWTTAVKKLMIIENQIKMIGRGYKNMKKLIRINVIILLLLSLGCSETKEKVKAEGKEIIESAKVVKDLTSSVDLAAIANYFKSQNLDLAKLSDLYKEKKWDEADQWIQSIDDEAVKTSFKTIGEVLILEEQEGVENSCKKIDLLLQDEQLNSSRKRTLTFMKSYISSKGGLKSSEIIITVVCVAIMCKGGGGGGLEIHPGTKTDQIVLLARMLLESLAKGKEQVEAAPQTNEAD